MKKLLRKGLALLASLISFSFGAFAQDPNFHIYLCFGQSNMEGNGVIEAQDRTGVDARFQVMGAVNCSSGGKSYTIGKWQTATPPIFRCNTGLGPIDNFGRTMVANLPSNIKVGVVPVAIGGCDIALFDKVNYAAYIATAPSWMQGPIRDYGGNPYARLVEVAKLAQKDGVIKGILLHQGETNSGQTNWPTKIKSIYDNLIKDLGLDPTKTPLLAGELVTTAQGGACGGHNSIIARLPSVIPNSFLISASGLPHKGDNLHFTPAAYRTLGQRYAQKMITLLPSPCATAAPSVPTIKISYEVGETAKPLTAFGTSLKWYSVPSGGTAQTSAPVPSTTSAGLTMYYVSQTANGCESPRNSIAVSVASIYKLYQTPIPIEIDGQVDAIWNNVSTLEAITGKLLTGTVSNSSDLFGAFKAVWDDTYLYVLAEVKDQTLNNDSPSSYDDDAVEVYVDINNDKATSYGTNDAQFTFGWNDGTTIGVLPSTQSTSGITYEAVQKSDGYRVEARIPWYTLKGAPSLNQVIGLEFMVNDDDNGGTRDKKMAWTASTDMAYQNPSLFGTARLMSTVMTTDLKQEENSSPSEILCYPNPFGSIIKVVTKGDFTYQLTNQLGQVVESNRNSDHIIVSHDYAKGIYLLKVIQEGKAKVFKLSKE